MTPRLDTWNLVNGSIKRRGKVSISPPLVGEPNASNTGLNVQGVDPASLTVITGDLSITESFTAANNGVLDRVWVKGHVLMNNTVNPFLFTNSLIEGRTFTGNAPYEAIIRARRVNDTQPTALINFENCLVRVVQPNVGISSAAGERLGYFKRCDISGGSDLLDYWNPAAPQVYQCYLHDYTFWANDPKHTNDSQHPGWAHPDYVQNSGSNGGVIIGNSFDVRAHPTLGDVQTLINGGFPLRNYGCAVMLTPGSGHITNIQIKNNYVRYGEVHFAMPYQNTATDGNNSWSVAYNQHDFNVHGYGPYGANYSKQFIRYGAQEGPVFTDVHDETFFNEPGVPSQWAGKPLPAFRNVSGTGPTGQYIMAVDWPTQ